MIYLNNNDALVVSNPETLAAKSHVSFADSGGTTLSGGRLNVTSSAASFNAATYTGANTRNVRTVAVTNEGTLAGVFTLIHSDGTIQSPLHSAVLQPKQTLSYTEGKGFDVSSAESATLATLTLPATPSPNLPSAGFGTVFVKSIGGRMMAGAIGPSGLDTVFQPHLGGNKCALWMPPGNTTVPGVFGMGALTLTGTAIARAVATANLLTRMTRYGTVSAATAASVCGLREPTGKYTIAAGPGLGGFHARYRFGVSDAATVAGARMFVGLDALTSAPTNVEPSAKVNCIGVGQLSTSANLHIIFGNATAKVPIDLGVNFPANTNSDAYELALFAPVSGGVSWQVTRLNTIFSASGFLPSTDVPVATTLLCHQLWRTNNATALAVGLDVCGIFIETDF